jgi:hypothetical protein
MRLFVMLVRFPEWHVACACRFTSKEILMTPQPNQPGPDIDEPGKPSRPDIPPSPEPPKPDDPSYPPPHPPTETPPPVPKA